MPFLIVETIENGSKKLSICPEGWVDNGILLWPTKKTVKKCKIEKLVPKDSWLKMPCIIKRKFGNYEAADAELNIMVELPETENEYVDGWPDNQDFNKFAKQLSSNGSANNNNASTIAAQKMQEYNNYIPTDNYSVSDDVPKRNNIMTENIDHNIETEVVQVLDFNDILTNQKKLSDNQVKILDNQIKILKTLATISVKIDNLASNSQKQPQIPTIKTVTPLTEIKKSPCNARVKPIQNLDDLDNMENQLRDADKRKFLKDLYSVFCTPGKKGEVCAFQLIDVMFSREFLVQCSWSGSARGACAKICIKIFQEVLGFFFELVHDCDPTYTVDKNNDFFKSIVKNAKKRTHSKLGRASAPRNVPKRKLATTTLNKAACNNSNYVDQNELIANLNTDKNKDENIESVIDKKAAIDNEVHADESTYENEND